MLSAYRSLSGDLPVELALAAGVRLDVVRRQLGHASIATTGNIYTHDTDEAAAEAAERLGRILERGQT